MRPKRLEIEGLQSFKELQVVDFSRLGATGLFGIFGPTGSGKSTILDAITFALYGKVKRAERGTQGIINMDRQVARVSFTFELLKDGNRKTYRVERAYQRKKNAANTGICEPKVVRLLEISPLGELPLCDKATEVSNQVEELLGLNHEDFTRAVVLPQNSFQEFLLLDNSKKRAMLERVFYLEEYGRRLIDKINRKMAGLKSEKDQLSGQMAAYGDATKEALAAVKKELKEANQERIQMAKNFSQVEAAYKALANLWQLTQELQAIEEQEAQLLERKTVMTQARQKLEQAQRADNLTSQIEQTSWYAQRLAEAQTQLTATQEKLPKAKNDLEKVKIALLELRAESARQQPVLVERKTQLTEGLAYVQQINSLDKELAGIRAVWLTQNEEIKVKEKELQTKEALLERDSTKLGQLAEELQGLRVKPAQRQALQQGLQLEEHCLALNKQLQDENETCTGLQKKLAEIKQEKDQAEEKLLNVTQEQKRWQDLLDKQEAAQNADAAYHLALSLEENKPCPVCGSLHHPLPALMRSDVRADVQSDEQPDVHSEEKGFSEKAIKLTRKSLAEATASLQSVQTQQLQLQTQFAFLSDKYQEQLIKCQELKEEADRAAKELQSFVASQPFSLKPGESIKAAWEALGKKDEAAWQVEDKHNKLQQSIETLRKEIQELNNALQPLRQDITITNTEGSSLAKQRKELAEKLQLLTGGLDIKEEITSIEEQLDKYKQLDQTYQDKQVELQAEYDQLLAQFMDWQNKQSMYQERWQKEDSRLKEMLTEQGFDSAEAVVEARLSQEQQAELKEELSDYDNTVAKLELEKKMHLDKLAGQRISQAQWLQMEADYKEALDKREASIARSETAKSQAALLETRHEQWQKVQAAFQSVAQMYEYYDQIQKLLKGDRNKDNSFIDYIAEERLRYVALKASEILGEMTQYKYGLELDVQLGFMIRDQANGGIHRMVSTLSGGEIFLTSLALALALSEQIQLKGQSPLEFFFLDEGFGTLDGDLLDTVMDALEGLSSQSRMIGLISHVPEMRCRLERRLIVEPPTVQGLGSRVKIEKA